MSVERTVPDPIPMPLPLLLFALVFPTLLTWLYFIVLAGSPAMKLVYSLGKALQFSFPYACVVLIQRKKFRIGPLKAQGLIRGALFGLVAGAAIVVLYT